MAKKTRTTSKKPARKAPAASSSKKKSAARTTVKKKTPASKPSAKKPAAKKPTSKKPAPKKAPSSPARKKAPAKKAPPSSKKTTKTPVSKVSTSKKAPAKKAPTKKPVPKKLVSKVTPPPSTKKKIEPKKKAVPKGGAAPATDAKGKPIRKGITIVSDRPRKRTPQKKKVARFPPTGPRLLGPDSPIRKPLIPSGPGRAQEVSRQRKAAAPNEKKIKSPFNKRELDKFKAILIAKRGELFGDMSQMESGALRSDSGALSRTPQHHAEQGSDSYDQSLALDLAAADRRLILEIDDALQRIEDRTFGICELTGKPIKKTRLEELPWARHSIEAARELERQSGFRA